MPRLSGAQASLELRFTATLPDYVHAVAFTPGGAQVAACAADGTVVTFATDGAGEPRELTGHPGGATCVAWSSRGVLASGGMDGTVRLDGAPVELGSGWVEAIAWRPDGELLAVAHRRQVHFLSPSGVIADVSADLPATVACLGWHPRGVELAAGSYGGVRLLRGNGAQVSKRLKWKGSVLALAISPDGRRLAHGNQDASVHFWDLKRRSELEMHGYATKVRELAWSPSGRWLATGGGDTITVWDFARPGGPAGSRPLELAHHSTQVSWLAFQPGGELLASSAADGLLLLWALPDDDLPLAGGAVDDAIVASAWSPDGRRIAVGGADGTVAVFGVGD